MDIEVERNPSEKNSEGGLIGFIKTMKNKFQGQNNIEGREDKNLK